MIFFDNSPVHNAVLQIFFLNIFIVIPAILLQMAVKLLEMAVKLNWIEWHKIQFH